ncbi:hypothetical protein [Undibacterium umbellatum]|uniref:Uncharacterized protein n=1 Tax=Undibacterium umbellatum TaxID=2762300 RepID=A0ABR6Z7A9_9BURK|nr:hypothetical protein [Undibacterium umbellatum]MBC3907635.1 hypothetical protein [Undibacterium umbellatum]
MNSTQTNDVRSKQIMFYGLIFCNISVLIYFAALAIFNKAPLLGFWLPALAFLVFYGYDSFKEHKKLDARIVPKARESIGLGLAFLLFSILILATRNWKNSPINMTDAFIFALLLSNTKDCMINLLAMHKFAGFHR